MFISLVKDPNVQFVRVRNKFFALTIICPIIFSSKSHFVQPNVVSPVLMLPAVPTFWTPAWGGSTAEGLMGPSEVRALPSGIARRT